MYIYLHELFSFCEGSSFLFPNYYAAVTEAGKVGDKLAQDFFRYEYILNHLIGESSVYWHDNM